MERCARAAMSAVGLRSARARDLQEVARTLVIAHLRHVDRLEALESAAIRAREELADLLVQDDPVAARAKAIETERRTLDEILLMIATPEEAAYVRLSSLLRKVGRPDLARQAASKAINANAKAGPAYCTRGAAAVDMDDLESAGGDLLRAWDLTRDKYASTALSRYYMAVENYEEALAWALKSVELDRCPESASVLIAAAWAIQDDTAIETAREILDSTPRTEDAEGPSVWLALVAAEHLARMGELDLAEAAAKPHAEGLYPIPRALTLLSRIRRERRRRQRFSGAGSIAN